MWLHPESNNTEGDQAAAGFAERFVKQHWSDDNGQLLTVHNSKAAELLAGEERHPL